MHLGIRSASEGHGENEMSKRKVRKICSSNRICGLLAGSVCFEYTIKLYFTYSHVYAVVGERCKSQGIKNEKRG